MLKDIILIGFFSETIELCERANYRIIGIVDNTCPNDYSHLYLGDDDFMIKNAIKFSSTPLVMVPDNPCLRKKLYEKYHSVGYSFETIVSPHAFVSKSAVIGEGCVIQNGCNISANVRLGICVRINTFANIMHDTIVERFSTIAPNSVVLGRCKIQEESYIGSNSTILPGTTIHRGAVVGAGAVVTKDVDEGKVVVGVPARNLD